MVNRKSSCSLSKEERPCNRKISTGQFTKMESRWKEDPFFLCIGLKDLIKDSSLNPTVVSSRPYERLGFTNNDYLKDSGQSRTLMAISMRSGHTWTMTSQTGRQE
jgi:hypothetical protein